MRTAKGLLARAGRVLRAHRTYVVAYQCYSSTHAASRSSIRNNLLHPSMRELPHKEHPPPLCLAATRSGSSLVKSLLPPSSYRAATRGRSSLPPNLLPPSLWQPRAAGSPRMKRLFLNQSSISAQWEISQKDPPPSLYLAAHPRARALPKRASPSLYLAATRSNSSPRKQPPSYLYLAAPR